MMMTTASAPTSAARMPLSMDSCPREGPTVRSSSTVTGAGREPARNTTARSCASASVKFPGDHGLAAGNTALDNRRGVDLAVQHNGHAATYVVARDPFKYAAAARVELQRDMNLPVLVVLRRALVMFSPLMSDWESSTREFPPVPFFST